MSVLLSTHRLLLLSTALRELIAERERRQEILHRYVQGQPRTRAMVALGDEINSARAALDDVNQHLAHATGMPQIQKGNADLANNYGNGGAR